MSDKAHDAAEKIVVQLEHYLRAREHNQFMAKTARNFLVLALEMAFDEISPQNTDSPIAPRQ